MKNLNQLTKDYFTFYGSLVGLACVSLMIAYMICAEEIIKVDHIKMPIAYRFTFLAFIVLLIISGIMFTMNILKKYNRVIW